jgi:PAS domain-containing protein
MLLIASGARGHRMPRPDPGHRHADVIEGVAAQLAPILEGSPQGVYIYLDDAHKVCNERFAELLGYASPEEWDRPAPFTQQYVDPRSHQTLVAAYRQAMERQLAATIDVTWRRLDGTPVPTTVMLVPIAFAGDLLALHFVTPHASS